MIPSYLGADQSILQLARQFSGSGIECGFVCPTAIGLKKSIIDAVLPVRVFFKKNRFHDFDRQSQGTQAKIIEKCNIVVGDKVISSKVSLYRPQTKNGDPRLWVYGLSGYASEGNVLAFFFWNDTLHVTNCSNRNISDELDDSSTLLGAIAASFRSQGLGVADELLGKLKSIGSMGRVKSMRKGSTGIGYTLESLLGIKANSNKAPDFKGIEIKSGRIASLNKKAVQQPRITLFSKTPSKKLSPLKPPELLDAYGYYSEIKERMQLYCSIDSEKRNSLGFLLAGGTIEETLSVKNNKKDSEDREDREVLIWDMNELRNAFSKKHKETFWVGAEASKINNEEWFNYVKIRHTKNPSPEVFELCLLAGGVCLDLTLSQKPSGAIRDHGYLFRIYRDYFDDLFESPEFYDI